MAPRERADPRALLLRGVSNHGVAIRLSPPHPPARATIARALVDFGVQVQVGERAGANGADASRVVGGIAIGGRPQGLFGAKHRSHTTAWVVFTDVVRSTILNQTLPTAVQRMSDLIEETRQLPGASAARLLALQDAQQVMRRVGGVLTGRAIYDRADTKADTAQQAVPFAGDGTLVAVLQDLVAAYLELRNATPLSVTHDTDTAGGHGEGTARGALVDDDEAADDPVADAREGTADELAAAQQGRVRLDPLTTRTHLWKLLDLAAVRHLVATQPRADPGYTTVPGNTPTETPATRLAAVVTQHLLTVRRAYPRPYVDAGMDSEASLRAALGDAVNTQLPSGATVLATIQGTLAGAAAVPAVADRTGVTVPNAAPRGTAQIILGDDNGTPIIAQLRLGSRPLGILGEAEGAHLTAFGLVVEGLKGVVEGAPLDEVGGRLGQLINHARGLATAYRAPDLLAHAALRAQTADTHANSAYARLAAAHTDDPAYVGLVQDLIVAYLWLRNSLPLAAVTEGGVPAGKAEGRMLGLLRDAEKGYNGDGPEPDDADVLDALWGLLDSAALNYVVGTDSFIASPGIRNKREDREQHRRAGDIISTHLRTATVAFPQCVAHTRMRTVQVVGAFLRGELPRVNQRPAAQANQDLAFTVNRSLAAQIAVYVITGAFPVVVAPAQAPARGRSRRESRPRKRPLDDAFEGEEAFGDMEREMVEEEEKIERPAKRVRY